MDDPRGATRKTFATPLPQLRFAALTRALLIPILRRFFDWFRFHPWRPQLDSRGAHLDRAPLIADVAPMSRRRAQSFSAPTLITNEDLCLNGGAYHYMKVKFGSMLAGTEPAVNANTHYAQ